MTPAARLAVRVAVLAVVAALGAIAQGVLPTGGGAERSAAPARQQDSPANTTESSGPETPDEAPDGPDGPGDSESNTSPVDGVPSGVAGGVGDGVRVGVMQLFAADLPPVGAPVGPEVPDVIATARGGAVPTGMEAFAPARGGAILWRSAGFRELVSGDEYGTRSLRTAHGLEARRIIWVTLEHRATGVAVSVINSTLESGDSEATESANRAYLQRVRDLTARLSTTSTVVVAGHAGQGRTVSVPDGNVHPGVVVALRSERPTAAGVSARLALQSPGPRH